MDPRDLDAHLPAEKVRMAALLAAAAFAVLLPVSRLNYLLFHASVETVSLLVAFGIFVVAWYTRDFVENAYLAVLGSGFLTVGFVTMLHAFAYKGMGVFSGRDADLATQLWIISRLLLAASFLLAVASFRVRLSPRWTLAGFSAATIGALATVWVWPVFPVMYVEGTGLTTLKVGLEYFVIALLAVSFALMWRERGRFAPRVSHTLLTAVGSMIVAELTFTLYAGVYDFANFLGHYFALVGSGLVFLALVDSALTRPFTLLFRELQERERSERRIAETLQTAILTVPESIASIEFGQAHVSATTNAKVGGDFYDLFTPQADLVAFVIGDMCGKGIGAAAATSMVRTTLRGFAYHDPSPAEVLWRANEALHHQMPHDRFATVLYGVIDVRTGVARVASAGHPAPVVCSENSAICLDVPTNPPLGVVPGFRFETAEIELASGDMLVMFTDGLLDAGRHEDAFGEERVADVVATLGTAPAALAPALLDAALSHARGRISDDMAVLALRLRSAAAEECAS
jgi:hypothetical protein